jgi:hypothetical protein
MQDTVREVRVSQAEPGPGPLQSNNQERKVR